MDQQATLEIPAALAVAGFDDADVSWNVGFWGRAYGIGKAVVQIPAGSHILTVDYYASTQSGLTIKTLTAHGMMLTYDFLPG
ncbi:MAG: hypothetical protein LBG27_02060 [Spirochaetaceae bacterium]|jgi:hypothetical protein|nr:hypothetical protein [Spirochaetaceae bacterium]